MTIYVYDLKIPANTTKENAIEREVSVKRGVVTRIIIGIPLGHKWLAGLQIQKGEIQLIPENPNAWIVGDNETLEFYMYYPVFEREEAFTLKGYNLDEYWDHTFYIRFEVLPFEFVYPGLRTAFEIRKLEGKVFKI